MFTELLENELFLFADESTTLIVFIFLCFSLRALFILFCSCCLDEDLLIEAPGPDLLPLESRESIFLCLEPVFFLETEFDSLFFDTLMLEFDKFFLVLFLVVLG